MAPNFDNTVYHFRNRELSVEYPFSMKPDLKPDYEETVSLQNFEDFIRTTYSVSYTHLTLPTNSLV